MDLTREHQSLTQTELDDIFMQRFNNTMPDVCTANDEVLFNQETSDLAADVEEEFASGGYFTKKSEASVHDEGGFDAFNQVVYRHETWSQKQIFSKEMVDDAKFNVIGKRVEQMGMDARSTQDRNAFGIYRNGFSTDYTGGDDKPLFAADHELELTGETLDNKIELALTEENLDEAIQYFLKLRGHNGVVNGLMPRALLVAPKNFKNARIINGSPLRAETADNDMNYYSAVYPGMSIKQTPHLAYGENADEDNWFLVGEMHGVKRKVREGVATSFKSWEDTDNDAWVYKARFRESYGWTSFLGVLGSQPA